MADVKKQANIRIKMRFSTPMRMTPDLYRRGISPYKRIVMSPENRTRSPNNSAIMSKTATNFSIMKPSLSTVLPMQLIRGTFTKDLQFESRIAIRMFESAKQEQTSKMEGVRNDLLQLLPEDNTLDDFLKLEKELADILECSKTYHRAIEVYQEKIVNLHSKGYLKEFECIMNETRYLRHLVRILKQIQHLYETELKDDQISMFKQWFKGEVSKLSKHQYAQTYFRVQAEKLLVDKVLRLQPDYIAVSERINKAINTLDTIGKIQKAINEEKRISAIFSLKVVKKNIETLGKFLSLYNEDRQMLYNLPQLREIVSQLKQKSKQFQSLLGLAVTLSQNRVIAEAENCSFKSKLSEDTPGLNEFIDLLQLVSQLSLRKSEFDCRIFLNVERHQQKRVRFRRYREAQEEAKGKILELTKEPIQGRQSHTMIKRILVQYQLIIENSSKMMAEFARSSVISHGLEKERPLLEKLAKLCDQVWRLAKKKNVIGLFEGLKAWTVEKKKQLPTKLDLLGSLGDDFQRIIALKKDISEISETLGGGLQITYDNSFIHHIEAVNELLKEYVWTSGRTRFEPQRLEQLVDEIGRDKWGLGADSQWLALYWNIACLLVEEIPFVNLPKNIADMDEIEYERFCVAIESNEILFKQAKELVSRVEKSGSKIAASLSKRISGFAAHYEQLKRIHSALQLIERQQQRLRGGEFSRDLDSKLDLLFEYAFTSQGGNETGAMLKSITEMCITIRAIALRLSTADDQQCLLVHRRMSNLVEPLTHCIQIVATTGLEGIEDTSELYNRLVHLRSAILQTVGAGNNPHHFEAVAPDLQERLVAHLQKRVQACVQKFVFSKQALPTQLIVKSKQQALRMRHDLEETVAIMGSIGAPMAEQIALQVSQRIFGAEQTNQHSLSSYGDRVAEAKKKVDSLGPLLEAFHQLRSLSATLGQLSGLVESLTGSSIGLEEQCQKMSKMTQMFRTRGADGWWTVRCRNHDLPEEALFYGQSQTAVQTFLKGLIHKVAPELSNADLATIFQSMVSITGQTCEINSISQYHIGTNLKLLDQVEYRQHQLEKSLKQLYLELWKTIITNQESFVQTVLKSFIEQAEAPSKIIQYEKCAIWFKPSVQSKIEQVSSTMQRLKNQAHQLLNSEISLAKIHLISLLIQELRLPLLKDLKDSDSKHIGLLYLSSESLKETIRTAILYLLETESRPSFRNTEIIDIWGKRLVSLQHYSKETVIQNIKYVYVNASGTADLSKIPEAKQLVLKLIRSIYQQSGRLSHVNQEMQDMEKILEDSQKYLQDQISAFNKCALQRFSWLQDIQQCMKATRLEIGQFCQWLKIAQGISRKIAQESSPSEQELKNMAMQVNILIPMLGLENQLCFLRDSQSHELGVFADTPENSLVSARNFFRKYYFGEVDYADEVITQVIKVKDGSISMIPYRFTLCLIKGNGISDELLKDYSIRVIANNKVIVTSNLVRSLEIDLCLDQVKSLRIDFIVDRLTKESIQIRDKELEGNEIRFRQLEAQLRVDLKQKTALDKLEHEIQDDLHSEDEIQPRTKLPLGQNEDDR